MANRLTGKIVRLNADRSGILIGLDNDPSSGPQDNHFRLNLDHANYNAVYSTALAAAANRWPVSIVAVGGRPRSQQRSPHSPYCS